MNFKRHCIIVKFEHTCFKFPSFEVRSWIYRLRSAANRKVYVCAVCLTHLGRWLVPALISGPLVNIPWGKRRSNCSISCEWKGGELLPCRAHSRKGGYSWWLSRNAALSMPLWYLCYQKEDQQPWHTVGLGECNSSEFLLLLWRGNNPVCRENAVDLKI